MATKVVSFGYKHGDHPDGNGLQIDVRPILRRNPYHNKRLRGLRGTDPEVRADIERTPDLESAYRRILDRVRAYPGPVYVGCTGGHHRSVYLADRIGRELMIPVEHRDLLKGENNGH